MRFSELAGRRVAVWGFGREGRAVIRALRRKLPAGQRLSLICLPAEAAAAKAFDPALEVLSAPPDVAILTAFDVVVKSPGISPYQPVVIAAKVAGTRFTSGTALWFAAHGAARVIAVTGTKGKSTTSALIAHLLRSLKVPTALAGNIGLPLLELEEATAKHPPAIWVLELSSFQTMEAGAVELGVFISLYEEHLDWHGSRERYLADKLRLAEVARSLLVNAEQPDLLSRTAAHPQRQGFATPAGWHLADGWICRGQRQVLACQQLPLPGEHNVRNACAALAAVELMGFDALAARSALRTFKPLPHRLQTLGEHSGLTWINDSISTTPEATLAALRSLQGQPVSIIIGGYDRGLDWRGFATEAMRLGAPTLITQGASGPRIAAELRAAAYRGLLRECVDLDAAIKAAKVLTPPGGVILLSPGAPSFDQFSDYAARGRSFAELAGFAVEMTMIEGLGVA